MSDFRNLDYHIMPKDQGQIVVYSYAVDEDYLYRRGYDTSDKTMAYSRAELDPYSEVEFQPWNNQLPEHKEWEDYVMRFSVSDDWYSEAIEADCMESALETAREIYQSGSWDAKCIISLVVQEIDWDDQPVGNSEIIEVECGEDPEPPECAEGCEHDWCSPYEVVGGLKESPGVWSLGGTTIHTSEVCSHCGWFRKHTAYGAQRNPGQCDHVEYDEPSDSSLEWIQSGDVRTGEE